MLPSFSTIAAQAGADHSLSPSVPPPSFDIPTSLHLVPSPTSAFQKWDIDSGIDTDEPSPPPSSSSIAIQHHRLPPAALSPSPRPLVPWETTSSYNFLLQDANHLWQRMEDDHAANETRHYSLMKRHLERALSGVQEGTCDTFQDAVADLENERESDIRNARINWEARRRETRNEIAARIAQLDKDVEAEKNALHTALLSAITEERVRLQKTGSCLPFEEVVEFASKRLQEKQRTNLKRNLKRSHMLAEKRPATRGSHAHENGRRRIAGIPDEPTHLMTAREEKEIHEEYLMLKRLCTRDTL